MRFDDLADCLGFLVLRLNAFDCWLVWWLLVSDYCVWVLLVGDCVFVLITFVYCAWCWFC